MGNLVCTARLSLKTCIYSMLYVRCACSLCQRCRGATWFPERSSHSATRVRMTKVSISGKPQEAQVGNQYSKTVVVLVYIRMKFGRLEVYIPSGSSVTAPYPAFPMYKGHCGSKRDQVPRSRCVLQLKCLQDFLAPYALLRCMLGALCKASLLPPYAFPESMVGPSTHDSCKHVLHVSPE